MPLHDIALPHGIDKDVEEDTDHAEQYMDSESDDDVVGGDGDCEQSVSKTKKKQKKRPLNLYVDRGPSKHTTFHCHDYDFLID